MNVRLLRLLLAGLCQTFLLFVPVFCYAQGTLPAPLAPIHPASNPALPRGADAFALPIAELPVSPAAPQFGEWTRNSVPDSTLIVYGANFAPTTSGGMFLVFAQGAKGLPQLLEAPLNHLDADSRALVQLPPTLPANSAYMLWAKNGAGYGRPILLNGTELWWAGSNMAAPGDTVSVYGRNLTYWNSAAYAAPKPLPTVSSISTPVLSASRSYIYLQPATGSGFWATVTSNNPYKVDFVLPASVATGTYEVWAHNGHGGVEMLEWAGFAHRCRPNSLERAGLQYSRLRRHAGRWNGR